MATAIEEEDKKKADTNAAANAVVMEDSGQKHYDLITLVDFRLYPLKNIGKDEEEYNDEDNDDDIEDLEVATHQVDAKSAVT